MAVPTFTSLTPSVGSPTGGQVVRVTGTNFQLTPPPPATGLVPVNPPTVRVSFGSFISPVVSVASDTLLYVRVPKGRLPLNGLETLGQLAVDITIENIDAAGVLIPGETATAPAAYTYQRPDISTSSESALTALTRELIRVLKSEVIANTVLSVHTDYDSQPATVLVESAEVPSVVLSGPALVKNLFYTDHARGEVDLGLGAIGTRRRPLHFDVEFDIIVITHSDMHLLNMMSLITNVIDRNSRFIFTCPPPVGVVAIDLEWSTGLSATKQTGQLNSNIRSARGAISFTGLPFGSIVGTVQDALQEVSTQLVGDVGLQPPEQIGDNLPAIQGSATRSPP